MSLSFEDLNVETFELESTYSDDVYIIRTVLYETEQISCGGTCQTCNCWA